MADSDSWEVVAGTLYVVSHQELLIYPTKHLLNWEGRASGQCSVDVLKINNFLGEIARADAALTADDLKVYLALPQQS